MAHNAATLGRMRRAWRNYRRTGSNQALRVYLISRAKLGIWDRRYCAYYSVDSNVSSSCKRFIVRGYAAGLVPTSTTGGQHAPGSFHKQKDAAGRGRAVDLGLRHEHVGTAEGLRRMERFQRSEFRRFARSGAIELIGPIAGLTVLRGISTSLAEGSALETQHDNHVHGAF
jgi:hypothetical protein